MLLYFIFDKEDLSIVVFVATIPEKDEFFTISIMSSIIVLLSSGEIFKNNGIFIFCLFTNLSTLVTKSTRFSSLCKFLKFGVFGDETLTVM